MPSEVEAQDVLEQGCDDDDDDDIVHVEWSWRGCGRGKAKSEYSQHLKNPRACALRSLDDDDEELEGVWRAALEGAQRSKQADALRTLDLSSLVRPLQTLCASPPGCSSEHHTGRLSRLSLPAHVPPGPAGLARCWCSC